MAVSKWMELAERIEAILKAALGTSSTALHKIPDANFFIRKFPWNIGVAHPGVFLIPVPERIAAYTNASDKWGYGIQTIITQASNRNLTSDHDRIHYWRELAIGQFLNQRINGLSQYFVTVEPSAVIDPAAFGAGYDATAFVLRCEAAQLRPAQAVPP